MKTDLAPTLIKSIDESMILWFQCSNRFTIVSSETYALLNQFFISGTAEHFINWLQYEQDFEEAHASQITNELEVFLTESNSAVALPIDQSKAEIVALPTSHTTTHYTLGNTRLQVHYGSEGIKRFFHPQLAHYTSEASETVGMTLNLFKIDQQLFLYRNENFVYACDTINYHFLQGAFAMELTNYIHDKIDCNWLATFHASTICNTNEAIMIVGESGNGKSTLSALLSANGMDLLADDFTPMYAEDLQVYRYPNAVSIKEGAFEVMEETVSQFKEMDTHFNGPKQVHIKYIPSLVDFASATKSVPCHKIVYVNYKKDANSTLKKTSAEQVLKTLIPDSWISPKPEHAKLFLDWLDTVAFYELQYSDNDYAIRSFKALFDE